MDVVLEGFDTFLFDRLYATFLPATSNYAPIPKLAADGTYSSMRQMPTRPSYSFRPASELFSFQPSDYAFMSQWPRNNVYRQTLSLYIITWLFGAVVYFICASLSYVFVFDKTTFKHPKYLKNQIPQEIKTTLIALPTMAVATVPFFLLEVRGWSKMYDKTIDGPGRWYDLFQFPLFFLFTDFCIYWIHRGLHHPSIYRSLHKKHHKWVVPTPFASHAFHPLDGFAQSLPYHVFPFIFPLQKFAYVALFTWINVWTVLIHDGEYAMNSSIINGAACHTMHHLYFRYNYGQFTTIWDRLGGSYRPPNEELFRREEKMGGDEWSRQVNEMERIVGEVEGKDEREFLVEAVREKKVL
ncbi:MAG: c-5 sterol desaturase [Chrysothrix sp. TS-e1954]|nr:MAG: c-5 sterol desaturase [Chrysothrix sp. TS-e1954]